MTDAQMYDRFLACDASCNGRFFIGVLTTGIYCLPSCKARKPKLENIRFLPNCEAARTLGLRACRKCHPDDFERGADPVLETIEALVAEIRAAPQNFPDVRAIVRRSGFGATRAFELFRQHYHATPADLLLRARLAAAKTALLVTDAPLLEIAARAGFESQSAFHEHFRVHNGLTPSAYRKLGYTGARSLKLALPKNYPVAHLLRALGRDPHSVTEKVSGATYTAGVRLGGVPAVLTLRFEKDSVGAHLACALTSGDSKIKGARKVRPCEIHDLVVAILGLAQDAPGFARLARRLGFARLVAGRENLRLTQTHSVFDALVWSIIGQQINLPFASLLRRRLIERTGTPVGDSGLYAPPAPGAVAALEPADLLPLQFSRQKADYLITAARLAASGKLDLEKLPAMSATRAERTLLAVRGLGPWSVNYIMMRALGFADCVPYGDTGVTSGLKTLLKLDTRPDIDATRRLMLPFSPHRSLATAHLWQLLQPPPAEAKAVCGLQFSVSSSRTTPSKTSPSRRRGGAEL